ncbi:unnamed protein product, partial [marine sediment metagenome]
VNPIPDFEKLVEGRFFERAVSNMIWVLWAYVLRKDERSPEEGSSVGRRYEKLRKVL